MSADPLAAALEAMVDRFCTTVDTMTRLLEHVTHLDGRVRELSDRVGELGSELLAEQAGRSIADRALVEQLEQLDGRLTSVHSAALRAMNLRHSGGPAA